MELLLYLLKVNIAIVTLYFLYKLVFQNDTMFVVKRIMLLFSLVFVLVYPMIDIFATWINSLSNSEIYIFDLSAIMPYAQPEIVAAGEAAKAVPRLSFAEIAIPALTMLYFAGIVFFSLRFIVQIISILRIIFSARKETVNGIDVLVSARTISPFSFFGKIIVSEKTYASAELNEILLHEQTHVRQWHSIDVIMSELLCIFAWFNPAARQLKKEIRLNLEYLADGAVIAKGCDAEQYQLNLVQLSYQKNVAAIANNFNFSSLKKRIVMMNKTKTKKTGLIKYLLILPVAFALMLLNTGATASPATYFDAGGVVEVEMIGIAIIQDEDPIFEVVEQAPEFPGGISALMQWLNGNMRYPAEAAAQGIQGRVTVSFVVEKDGSITNVQVLRGVDPLLDAEAVRVVQAMQNWQPGKQGGEAVRVRFNLPITFRLSADDATETAPPPPPLTPSNSNDPIFEVVEQPPVFSGGQVAMMQWLSENMRYPAEAAAQGIQGRVTVSVVVEKDGSLTDVRILRGVDPLLDAEAVRAVQAMPNWQPGRQGGEAVRVRFNVPITFRMQ